MAAADEPVQAAEADLTAEQYVILAEAQRKKRALAETRVKYTELVTENKRLLEEREQTENVTYEVTESMRRDIFTKNERVAALQMQLENQAAAAELQLSAQREELTERARSAAAAAGERETALSRQVDALSKELSDLEKFSREKGELERSRLRMRAEIDALQTKLGEAEAAEERRYIQGTMTLKKGFEQKYEELKKRHEEDVDERLDASVKRILQQNRRTAQELRLHMDESALLQKENQILLEERTKLLQELNVKVQLEQGYVARNARQSRDNKEAAGKLVALEQTLQSFVEGFERERQFMRDQWAKASANMSQEVDGYRRLVDLKMKEAKNVRRLAQEVLLQRSDVETFFISSLQHVRAQLEAGADGEARRPPTKGQRGRDIAELTWREREQVLRLAFAKINSQARSTHFRSLPRHSFAEPAAAQQRAAEEAVPVDTLSGLVSGAGQPQLA